MGRYSTTFTVPAFPPQLTETMKRRYVLILGLAVIAAPDTARLTTARVLPTALGWISSAQAAEDLVLDNLTFAVGPVEIKIPRIAIAGSSLSRSEVEALLKAPTADALARLNAASIAIPELTLTMTLPGTREDVSIASRTIYRDIHADGIVNGKVSRITASGVNADTNGPTPISYTTGPLSVSDLDLAAMAYMATAKAQPDEALRQLSGPASIEAIHYKVRNDAVLGHAENIELDIGRIDTGTVKMRPLTHAPLSDAVRLRADDVQAAAGYLADFYNAFAADGMTMSELSIKVPNPSFRNASLKRFRTGAIANSRIEEFGIEGLEVNTAEGHVKLDQATLFGFDFQPFLSSLSEMAGKADTGSTAVAPPDWRAAMPHLDRVQIKGLNVVALASDLPEKPGDPPRLHSTASIGLAAYDLKLGNYVGAIPTRIRSELRDLTIAVDPRLLPKVVKTRPLSSTIDLAWNESCKFIAANEVSIRAADLGTVSLKGMLENVPRELFGGTNGEMASAAYDVSLGEANFRLEDSGLLEHLLARLAERKNTTPDKLRAQWSGQQEGGLSQVLGESEQAKAVATAIASFLAKPQNLSISLKSKDGAAIRVTDLTGLDPEDIFEDLDVSAIANSPAAGPATSQDASRETFKDKQAWIDALMARLNQHRRYPGDRKSPSADVRIDFSIDHDGHILSTAVKQSSGDPAFDTAAQCMVERSNPLPPPPPSVNPDANVMKFTLPVNFREHR